MVKRRHIKKENFDSKEFIIFVRFMIVVAENKRVVTYSELTKVFGIPLEDIRDYAAHLGNYCHKEGLPYLNSLIISSEEGRSGDDFFVWVEDKKDSWGAYVAECFSHFHIPTGNSLKYKNTREINGSIEKYLES